MAIHMVTGMPTKQHPVEAVFYQLWEPGIEFELRCPNCHCYFGRLTFTDEFSVYGIVNGVNEGLEKARVLSEQYPCLDAVGR